MSIDAAKKAAGEKAAFLIQDGMTVGLGTGTTARCFIDSLILRVKKGLRIQVAATSQKSLELAKKGGIPLLDIDKITSLDIAVDGADEIDPQKQMIKGGGGALLREKIIASMSREMVVIVDETKLVSQLGKHKLPVEIAPFGFSSTLHKLVQAGFTGSLRLQKNKTPYLTDNGNYIFDICLKPPVHPLEDHLRLLQIPGVLETGFFFNLAGRIVVGFFDGTVTVQ